MGSASLVGLGVMIAVMPVNASILHLRRNETVKTQIRQ